jgi:hypothetical protein
VKRNKSASGHLQAWAIAVTGFVLLLAVAAVSAQSEDDQRYFDETGHTISGAFLKFFDEHGGLEIFGYPITEQFVDANGLLVQYFQRARFEWRPDNPEGFKVQLGLLGDELGYARPPLPASQIPAANNPRCKYFSETRHSVCYAFLDYFQDRGGIDVFGYPISEAISQGDRIVQYFQRAQMVWHPEKLTRRKVQLALIGSVAFDEFGLPRELLDPVDSPTFRVVTSLTVWASVQNPVTDRAGSQLVYIFVGDQHRNPVAGARVRAIVHLASGDQTFDFPSTNSQGVTQRDIPFGTTKPGEKISIDILVEFNDLKGRTRTSFLPWW